MSPALVLDDKDVANATLAMRQSLFSKEQFSWISSVIMLGAGVGE